MQTFYFSNAVNKESKVTFKIQLTW